MRLCERGRNPRHVARLTDVRRYAFTLAEVLVTLGIIGVISALTVPSLMQRNAEKQYAVRLQKFYSLMNQAIAQARLERGDINYWGLSLSGNKAEDELTDEEIAAGKLSVESRGFHRLDDSCLHALHRDSGITPLSVRCY